MRFVVIALGLACAAAAPACAGSERPEEDLRPAGDVGVPNDERPSPPGSDTCTNPESLPELPRLGLRRCMGLPSSATSDPSKPGKSPVGVKTLTLSDPTRPGRTLTTEVWYPAAESARGKSGTKYGAKVSDIAKQMGTEIPI